ncbi:ABC transporter substrate-binding protein [Chloroflexota bacterium]
MAGFAETLANFDEEYNLVGILATSWDVDYAGKTITLHLREGVKFHDGTDFNAEAVKWNLELQAEAGLIGGAKYIESISAVDNYTVRLNLSQLSPLAVDAYLQYALMFSPTATEKNGKEWARTNPVGTGPFKISDFQRETFLVCDRFDGYWQPGRPYLDSIEVRVVPDPLTASATMLAGDADMWINQSGLPLKEASELANRGLKAATLPGRFYTLSPDSANPGSIFADKRVREAVEYAIDKPAIAKAIGLGLAEPLTQLAPKNAIFYNPDYTGRPYDPAKARQLLADAGYPTGFDTVLTMPSRSPERDFATAVQGYLTEVGINTKFVVCDRAKWTATRQGKQGWDGLLTQSEVMNPGLSYIQNFTKNFQAGGRAKSTARSPEFLAIIDEIYSATDEEGIASSGRKLIRQAAEDAMTIPYVAWPALAVTQKYVNSAYLIESPVTNYWHLESDWMEKK